MNDEQKQDDKAGIYVTRSGLIEDVPFIISSWGDSYYDGGSGNVVGRKLFHKHHRPIREKLTENCYVIVACSASESWHIWGWVCYAVEDNHKIIHYLYVKKVFRELNIAKTLLEKVGLEGPVIYTHYTHTAGKIMAEHPEQFKQFKYQPHLI